MRFVRSTEAKVAISAKAVVASDLGTVDSRVLDVQNDCDGLLPRFCPPPTVTNDPYLQEAAPNAYVCINYASQRFFISTSRTLSSQYIPHACPLF